MLDTENRDFGRRAAAREAGPALAVVAEAASAPAAPAAGMPLGAPGMESPSGERHPFQTLLLLPDGGAQVFAQHG